ncbi:MAG: hypothetical protein WCF77_02925 [Minisyncoccia bacterium]
MINMTATLQSIGTGVLRSILIAWSEVWWIVLPLIVLFIFWDFWVFYLHVRFVKAISWKLLEIKVPKNVLKTPKAMEQIFAAAHAPYTYGIVPFDKYWKGKEEWFMSFELIGHAGESHFYLRLPKDFQHMMESAIYAQYPEAEITEVDDYLDHFPEVLPNEELDVSGFEEMLKNANYLPIRTYLAFEDPTEERRLDTIAPIMEVMSKLKDDEQVWYQLVIRPTGEDFKKEGEGKINQLLGIESKEKKGGLFAGFGPGVTLGEVVRAPFEHPGESKKKEEKQNFMRFIITPGEKDVTEAIEEKISKIAFETTPRFLFLTKQGNSDPGVVSALHGFVRQFNTQNLNSLRPNSVKTTASYAVRGMFKKTRIRWRKRMIYEDYRNISPSDKKSVLNIEELATIYHFPIAAVSTTELEKIPSRRGSPPAGVPTIEEE